MLSKCTTLLVTSLAFLAPLTMPSNLQAAPSGWVAVPVYAHHHRYFVEYRSYFNGTWGVLGPYRSSAYAHDVARDLRVRGIPARVVHR